MAKKKLYTIIDIETTGGASKYDKITEIGIVLSDGEKTLETYHSLVNPERSIPPYISNITGITDDMVKDAPKFFEIARDIVEITENAVFVAHNVRFDFGFIQTEFQKLGYHFNKKQLCTVKLSRKAFPGLKSYSLGNLIKHFDLEVNARHRALDDAVATTTIFHKILNTAAGSESINQIVNLGIKESKLPQGITIDDLDQLPKTAGVYYMRGESGSILYIGKSINIQKRVLQHFSKVTPKSTRFVQRVRQISFEETGTELIALLKESTEIKSMQPEFNKAQRTKSYPYFVHHFLDLSGYLRFEILKSNTKNKYGKQIIGFFKNTPSAKAKMAQVMTEYGLCQILCGLEQTEGACFQHKIKACNGACIQEESAEDYNSRAMKAIDEIKKILDKNMFILGDGRQEDEASLVLIEDGDYKGYGYIPKEDIKYGIEELKEAIHYEDQNIEANRIVFNFLEKNFPRTIEF